MGPIVSDRGFNKKEKAKGERRDLGGGGGDLYLQEMRPGLQRQGSGKKREGSLQLHLCFWFCLLLFYSPFSQTTTSPRYIASITEFKVITANA